MYVRQFPCKSGSNVERSISESKAPYISNKARSLSLLPCAALLDRSKFLKEKKIGEILQGAFFCLQLLRLLRLRILIFLS